MKTDISCLKPWALVQYVQNRNPDQSALLWDFLKKELGERVPAEPYIQNPRNRISVESCKTAMALAKKATSDNMAAFKAAFTYGRPRHLKKNHLFCSPFGLMRDLLQQAQQSDMLQGKKIEFVTISDTHLVVRVHWPEGLSLNKDFCLYEQGLYQALPKEYGLAPARLWERTCYFKGGPFCEYEIWWNQDAPDKKISWRMFFPKSDRSKDRKGNGAAAIPYVPEKVPQRPLRPSSTHPVVASETASAGKLPLSETGHDSSKRGELVEENTDKPDDVSRSGIAGGEEGVLKHNQPIYRQFGHLFDGLGRIVDMMLFETNSDHPHVEHLKRMRFLLQRGNALRAELLSRVRSGGGPEVPQGGESALKGTGAVLLVDMDKTVRDEGRQMLSSMGYDVVVAASDHEALDLYNKKGERFDLVIMDTRLPGVNGKAAIEEMKKADPAVQFLLAGIHPKENAEKVARTLGCQGFIGKPFVMHDLFAEVERILSGNRV